MTYQVTARKYRPQTFADLIGQDHIRRTLQNALKRDRVAHAYIFSGPRGVGKTTVARLLAKAVNCERRSAAAAGGEALPDEPCNECSSCREIVEDRHPDVLEIDGASNTGVDNVRDLREQVRYAPARGRCKVYVIDEVHMLSKGAFNALLKTLEEPPPGVLFVFATTEPERIPATIASRCQCFDFHRLSPAVIAAHLTRIAEGEGRAVDRAAIQLLARTAEGSMRDAQSLFDQVVAFAAGREDDGPLGEAEVSEVLGLVAGSVLWKVARMIARDDAPGLLEVARGIFQEGQDVKQFCLSLMGFLRDLRVAEGVEDPAGLLDLTPEEMEELRALAKEFGREKLHRCFRMAMDVERDVRLATNPQPVLEMALLRMASLRPAVPLEAVLEKLRSVEAALGLAGSGPPGAGLAEDRELAAPAAGTTRSREDPSRGPAGPPPGAPPTPSPPAEGVRVEEPPPPPPSEPDSGVQPGLWQRLLHEVGTLKKPVVHYLENGRLVSVEDGEVRIGVVGYNLSRAKDHQQVIMQAVRRIWGEGNKVLLVPVAPPPESAASGAAQANGGRAAALVDEDPHPGAELKFMEDVLRDVDEIFGDAGGAGEAPSAPPA